MGLTTVQRYCAACDFIFCENATNLIIIMIVIRGDAMGGALGSRALPPTGTGCPFPNERELQWKNWLTRACLLAVKVVIVNVMAPSLLSLLHSVNEHYIL